MRRPLAAKLATAAAVFLVFGVAPTAFASTIIDVNTSNASNWFVTGAGATSATAFPFSGFGASGISLTSNGNRTGSFVSGGSLANFNGFWYADFPFTLPSNATDIALSFSGLFGDDRMVLQLNGINIGNFRYDNPAGTNDLMSFPPGPPDVPFTFTNQTSGTITSGFLTGQVNTLRLIVGNTATAQPFTPTRTFQGDGDNTWVEVAGIVNYSVPEPSTSDLAVLSTLALVLLFAHAKKVGQSSKTASPDS